MSGQVGAALALGLALVLSPGFAGAQSQVEGELNRAKAAMQLKKYDEAAVRFEKLARTGNPTAQFYMGRLTAMGRGVAKDPPKAVNWFDLSATVGPHVSLRLRREGRSGQGPRPVSALRRSRQPESAGGPISDRRTSTTGGSLIHERDQRLPAPGQRRRARRHVP
ncbi:MAG TPA: hypothetical protein VK736_00395, partial [Candidatus Binatia bacterium]|nr:hypothetical protein [Candidatus Binatia bacterium]